MVGDKPLRTLLLALAVVALSGLFVAAGPVAAQTDQPTETPDENVSEGENVTQVRAVHVSPVLPNVDVFVEGEPLGTNVTFADVTEYLEVEPGDNEFTVTVNETGEQILERTVPIEENVSYTLLAVGTLGEDETVQFQPILLRDDIERPSAENASLRFINAAPDAPPLNLTIRELDATAAANVSFRGDSGYATLPAGNYTLDVTNAETGDLVVTRNVSLEGGTVSSAITVGFVDPEAAGVDFPVAVALTDDAQLPDAGNATATPTEGEEEATPTPAPAGE